MLAALAVTAAVAAAFYAYAARGAANEALRAAQHALDIAEAIEPSEAARRRIEWAKQWWRE